MRDTKPPCCTEDQRGIHRWTRAAGHTWSRVGDVAAQHDSGQPEARIERLFVAFARLSASLVLVTALVVLAGWIWNLQLLTTFVPGEHSMKANVAFAFALSGGALLLSRGTGWKWPMMSKTLSLLVLAIGAATFSQYVWALDLGMDTILLPASQSSKGGLAPSRMPELIAVALMLLGGQGLLVSTGRWLLLREGLAVALLGIAMMGLASYGLSLAERAGSQFERVPVHTVVLLLLVAALGWMAVAPGTGLTRVATASTFGGKFARRLLLPSLLLPVVFASGMEWLRWWFEVPRPFAFALAAVLAGGTVAWLVWWVAALLDKVERQRRESASLRAVAATDALTALPNRRAFDEMLANLLKGHREADAAFSMLLLDLDNFKAYNDEFGHQEGDEVLRHVAGILRAALRPSDFVARFGGEEFVVLLPGTDAFRAELMATRILDEFRAFHWPLRAITVSIGAAEVRAGESARGLVRRTDRALYQAKHGGRDQAVVAAVPRAASSAEYARDRPA